MSTIDSQGDGIAEVNKTVRYAATFLLTFAIINVARETTYLIGGIQYHGAPSPQHYWGMFHALVSLALGGLTHGLKHRSRKAWFSTIFGGAFLTYHIAQEFAGFIRYVTSGGHDGDVQLVLLGFALAMLILPLFLLLTPQGRRPFFHHATSH